MTKQRLLDTFSISPDIQPKETAIKDEKLLINWPDGHESVHYIDWLKLHAYDPPLIQQNSSSSLLRQEYLWNHDKIKSANMLNVEFEDVMESDEGLAKWLENIDIFGFSWVNNVPVNPQTTEKLARRISFIRETHYGTFWDFTSNLEHMDTAYTSLAIEAHTDTTYFTDPIGLQLFHLLEHRGTGGETLLIDGFHLAQEFKAKYPDYFNTLSTIGIPTHSAGDESIFITPTPKIGYPIIRVDKHSNKVFQVRYNNHDRSVLSGTNMSKDDIDRIYAALRAWNSMLKDEANEYWVKMEPGKVLIMNNWRVLHGRSEFTGYRRLCGSYTNWDDYKSRISRTLDAGNLRKDL